MHCEVVMSTFLHFDLAHSPDLFKQLYIDAQHACLSLNELLLIPRQNLLRK